MVPKSDFRSRFGQWALVIGSSTGLGAAWARECASRGMDVVLCANSDQGLGEMADELRERYGVRTRTFLVDIADARATEVVLENVGDLDVGVFIYNAAIVQTGYFVDIAEQDHVDQVVGNGLTPVRLTHHFSRAMAQRKRGAILLVSSMAAAQGTANQASYSGTKALMAMLGESLWYEMARYGVRAAAVTVGAVATPHYAQVQHAVEAAHGSDVPQDLGSGEHETAETHAPRPRTPGEVAAYVLDHIDEGPRLFSHPEDQMTFESMAALPRDVAVNAISAVTDRYFSAGFDHLESLPRLPEDQWLDQTTPGGVQSRSAGTPA